MKMVSTSDVLDRHLKSFAEHDVDGVVSDYSSDAVLFAPGGALKGPTAIRPLFEALIAEFAKPSSSFTMQLHDRNRVEGVGPGRCQISVGRAAARTNRRD
jgi:ketosteroid isomerase-like protein